jgi:endonuclease YncB( thermonuclease family)
MKIMNKLLISLILLAFSFKSEYPAKVIGVTDGDTIIVLTGKNQQIKIRLEGIDCPESKHDFGDRAKQTTLNLCFGNEVTVKETGKDRYGRTLAFVYVGEICINKELLRQVMAWHFKKCNQDHELAALELKAQESKIGLWSLSNSISPWDW